MWKKYLRIASLVWATVSTHLRSVQKNTPQLRARFRPLGLCKENQSSVHFHTIWPCPRWRHLYDIVECGIFQLNSRKMKHHWPSAYVGQTWLNDNEKVMSGLCWYKRWCKILHFWVAGVASIASPAQVHAATSTFAGQGECQSRPYTWTVACPFKTAMTISLARSPGLRSLTKSWHVGTLGLPVWRNHTGVYYCTYISILPYSHCRLGS